VKTPAISLLLLAACASPSVPRDADGQEIVATFSIVAYDPETKELGIAVQSKFIAVGAVVPFAKAGVGAVATQAFANTTFGPKALELMEKGDKPEDILTKILEPDKDRERRQVGIVNAKGQAASFTGKKCMEWAGGITEENFCCQGNILAAEEVVKGMAKAFQSAKGDLGDRLIAALQGGQEAGGDKRGMQSAALLIVHEGWGYGGFNDRYRDLRVDDHEKPIDELKRIYDLHRKIFAAPKK
jgi:uncharacterized Ntn-hydrolase superfamily protein